MVGQFATSLDANFYSPTLGLEVTRVVLGIGLSKDLETSIVFMNTAMLECDPVYVEPLEGLYEYSDKVWCLKRALNGLRDAPRLFEETIG